MRFVGRSGPSFKAESPLESFESPSKQVPEPVEEFVVIRGSGNFSAIRLPTSNRNYLGISSLLDIPKITGISHNSSVDHWSPCENSGMTTYLGWFISNQPLSPSLQSSHNFRRACFLQANDDRVRTVRRREGPRPENDEVHRSSLNGIQREITGTVDFELMAAFIDWHVFVKMFV